MTGDTMLQEHNLRSETLMTLTEDSATPFDEQVHTEQTRREVDAGESRALRLAVAAVFFASGALSAGALAAAITDGWKIVLAALIGGVWGVFIGASCQVAGTEGRGD